MTSIQDREQCLGPGRPSVRELREFLDQCPSHFGIDAIAINGQTGTVTVELRHEDGLSIKSFSVGPGAAFSR